MVLELGLLVGLPGRERVAALHTPSIELPTDFLGVAYIDLTYSWQIELAKELNAAGIQASVGHTRPVPRLATSSGVPRLNLLVVKHFQNPSQERVS